MAEEPHSILVLSFQASKRKRYRVSFIILICQMGKKSLHRKSIIPYCFYGYRFIQFQISLKSRGGCLLGICFISEKTVNLQFRLHGEGLKVDRTHYHLWETSAWNVFLLKGFQRQKINLVTSKHNPECTFLRESVYKFCERISPARFMSSSRMAYSQAPRIPTLSLPMLSAWGTGGLPQTLSILG